MSWRVHDLKLQILARSSRSVGATITRLEPLDETLRFVQMSGIFYCPSELTEPWGIELPPMPDCVWFHAVNAGRCTLEVEGEAVELGPGDFVLIPHGTGHRAWGAAPAPTPNVLDLPHDEISDRYAVLRHGGGGATTSLVCGGIRFDQPVARKLAESLPPLIHIEAARSTRTDWMQATLELLADEVRHVRPGNEAVVSRLCDIVVIQAVRTWIERDPGARTGWLGALGDGQIGAAMAAIHAEPGHPWTVAGLATEVGMSRSAFAARFATLVGEPAMRYVTRWRMQVALHRLQESDATVATIAAEVGYDSEAAFSRAFKRVCGAPPRAMRAGVG